MRISYAGKGCFSHVPYTMSLSFEQVLDAAQSGTTVILCEHSNSERGFLKHLKEKIKDLLAEEEEGGDNGQPVVVNISKRDRDPLTVV